MAKKFRIAVFASGNGSNAEEIFRYFQHHPTIKVILLLSNNANATVLARAQAFSIPVKIFSKIQFANDEVLGWLKDVEATHLVLAGFLWLLPQKIIDSFSDRIVNIHPALLPKFGGKGMYGMNVHEKVKSSGEKMTGITIHLVNNEYDKGVVLEQITCALSEQDNPAQIAAKVSQLELAHYAGVIERWITGNLVSKSSG